MAETYDHDVFISYASADAPWAEALEKALVAKGLDVFRDATRIGAGNEWRHELLAALQKSRHFVLLWSDKAAASQWVTEERVRFGLIVDPKGEGLTGDRRMILVSLEGENPTFAHLQQVTAIREAALYPGAPDTKHEAWRRVVERIVDAIGAEKGFTPIPLLLVTTTRAALEASSGQPAPSDYPNLGELLSKLSIASPEELRERYGESRREWRPFGSGRTIETILSSLKDKLNAEIASVAGPEGRRFRWDYVDEDFWGDLEGAKTVTRRLLSEPGLVVVDPLSFYDDLVRTRYTNYVIDLLGNGETFVLVLTPFASPPPHVALRAATEVFARRIFQHFYEPPAFTGDAYARCGFNVADEVEFRGWLTAAIGPRLAVPRPAGSRFLESRTRP